MVQTVSYWPLTPPPPFPHLPSVLQKVTDHKYQHPYSSSRKICLYPLTNRSRNRSGGYQLIFRSHFYWMQLQQNSHYLTHMGLNKCQIIGIMIRWYIYWPKFLHINFHYCSYTCTVQLSRRVYHLDISFICWFMVIKANFHVFWSLHILQS